MDIIGSASRQPEDARDAWRVRPPDPRRGEHNLSHRARSIDVAGIERVRWAHDGSHPGSPFVWCLMTCLFRFGWLSVFRHRTSSAVEPVDPARGSICFAWHTSGLVDPVAIMMTHPHRLLGIGRHDLVTRPPVGWWVRKTGGQPIIRKREIDAGLIDEATARRINARGLGTMAHALAGGAGAIIMPEGTSHLDPFIRPLRSGVFRIAVNASAIAEQRGWTRPVVQPVGLHYRNSTRFRSDVHVEYDEPLTMPSTGIDGADAERLVSGEWIEPPEAIVETLRDRGEAALRRLTPDAATWAETHRWDVIAHVESAERGRPLSGLQAEVLARRSVRDRLRSLDEPALDPLLEAADEVAALLLEHDLDGRAIASGELDTSIGRPLLGALAALLLLLISLPVSLPVSLVPLLIGRWLGDRTDEGLDNRVTIHLVIASFKSFLITPVIVAPLLIWLFLTMGFSPSMSLLLTLLSLPLACLATQPFDLLTLKAFDLLDDLLTAGRRRRLGSRDTGAGLSAAIERLRAATAVLSTPAST